MYTLSVFYNNRLIIKTYNYLFEAKSFYRFKEPDFNIFAFRALFQGLQGLFQELLKF